MVVWSLWNVFTSTMNIIIWPAHGIFSKKWKAIVKHWRLIERYNCIIFLLSKFLLEMVKIKIKYQQYSFLFFLSIFITSLIWFGDYQPHPIAVEESNYSPPTKFRAITTNQLTILFSFLVLTLLFCFHHNININYTWQFAHT
jgi:hypothetical protein